MNPKSFSATALAVADMCTARYKAEMIDRTRGFGGYGPAATLGSAVHGALEQYVKIIYLDKTQTPREELLQDLFKISYMTEFDTVELATEAYFEGVDMLKKWYQRSLTQMEGRTVLSVEKKDNFPIKTSIGEIPFNYIWDRFDDVGGGEYKVVDYKTNKWGIRPDDLRKKIQARAYGVAAAIQLHAQGIEPKRIWVEFDMLRHDGPVGIAFSREDNIATLKFLRGLAQKIVDTPESEVKETLNNECLFCVRKQGCKALIKNIAVGGVHSVGSVEEAIDARAQLELQSKAVTAAIKELDSKILDEAKVMDQTHFESDTFALDIGMSSQRAIDAEMVEMAIGPKLFNKYGGKSFTMKSVDNLMKGDELDAAQKKQLASLIYMKKGEPRVRVEGKSPIDD